jgi:hypothetical protein
MKVTLTHQVMDERCALARLGRAGRMAHDMRVNGPLKSGPLAGTRFSFVVLFFGCLAVKFKILTGRYKDLN